MSDEQIHDIDHNPFPRCTDAMEHLRDLYESHLKEKEELLREAADALEEVLGGSRQSLCDHLSHPLAGDRHRMGEPCPPAARLEALLSRINEHLKP